MKKPCARCGNPVKENRSKYCGIDCANKHKCGNGFEMWIDCAVCHAAVGIGMKTSAKILKIVKAGAIRGRLKSIGVDRADNGYMSWNDFARKRASEERRLNEIWEREWMGEIRGNPFFDWSEIWGKERARRNAPKYYRYGNWTEEERKAHNRQCYERRMADPEKHRKTRQEWVEKKKKDPEWKKKRSEYAILWKKRLRERGEWVPRHQKLTGIQKVKHNLRKRMRDIIRGKGGNCQDLIGCTTEEFKRHLEEQFDRWMTWENYGSKWHVDHIMPVSAFDHTQPHQVRQCWHFTNLRPLCAKKNEAKSDTITHPQLALML